MTDTVIPFPGKADAADDPTAQAYALLADLLTQYGNLDAAALALRLGTQHKLLSDKVDQFGTLVAEMNEATRQLREASITYSAEHG